MIDSILSWGIAYVEAGVEYIASYLMTLEGMVGLMMGMFLLDLIAGLKRR